MEREKKVKAGGFLLRLFQGMLVGISGVLPGISGGVLCVVFGVYKPVMEVLSSPFKKIKEHWRLLLPIAVGSAVGFILLVHGVSSLLKNYEALATCVFAGLILGTLPSLIRTAGKEKRTAKSYTAFFVSFAIFFTLFMFLEHGVGFSITPSFLWFALAGAIWGISIVLPGLSSSAILLFLDLFEPIIEGAKHFDFGVLIPLAVGGVGAIVLFAKLINMLYEKHFSVMSHIIIGIVVATTIPIIPLHFASVSAFFVQFVLIVLGFGVAMLFGYVGNKLQ
ncbi:MAG: DUF368 domain-containing protein [Clostridia bacterium]|nr:DUF368 domain-containing protein [Clostridia bacterium]